MKLIPRRRRGAAAAFGCFGIALPFLFSAVTAVAQLATSSITGSVVAPTGAGLPGALVTITPAEGGPALHVVAGERGVFRASILQPGAVTVRAQAQGFSATTLAPVSLAPGESREVVVVLSVSAVRGVVTVIGSSPRDSVEAEGIRESPAKDAAEALSSAPGMWKLRKGGIANDTVVRGYQAKDLNVLIDGQRIYGACPGHMDPPSFHADFAEIDRIEVGKGPFDVKNQGSLGGIVNIVTRRPDTGWNASANVAGGSAAYVNPSATLSFRNELFSALGGFSWRQGDAYSDGSGRRFTEITNYKPQYVDATAFEATTAWGKVGLMPADGHLVELSYTHQDADAIFYPALQMDALYDGSDRLNLEYELAKGGAVLSALKAQGYYTRVNHWMTDELRTSSGMGSKPYSMGTMASSRTAGGKLEARLFSELTTGIEVYQRFWEAVNEMAMSGYKPAYTIPDATSDFAGIYAEWKHPLSTTLSLGAGARVDRAATEADPTKANTDLYWAYNSTRSTSRTDVLPSGNVRLIYSTSDGLELAFGVGSNVRAPEPNERYYAHKRSGSDWVGNPELDPSRNTGAELSFSLRRSGFFASANAFANRVNDYVAVHDQPRVNMVPGVMNTKARSYTNVDATLVGGEVTAAWSMTQRLFLSGDVSYVRGSQEVDPSRQVTSTNLAEMPPLRGRAALRYDTGRTWVEAEGVFSAAQDRVDPTLQEQPTPGWGIANAKAGATFGALTLTVGVGNLFDRTYYESLSYQRDPYRSGVKVPEPGRNVFANLGWRY